MASKRKILDGLTKASLLELAQLHEMTGLSGKSKAEIIDAMAGNRRVQAEDFLGLLSRDDLKTLCSGLGLDDSGREKQLLIDRLLGKADDEATPQATTRNAMAKKKAKSDDGGLNVEDYRFTEAKRKNNPPAKIAAEGVVPAMPKIEYSYSPRRPPVLRFDPTGKADQLPELLEKATRGPLSKDEAQILAEALRTQQAWLEWAGKREAESMGFTVDPVALHIHERISAQAILRVAARQDVERTLFGDPEQEYHEAVQFYKHDIDWTNRLILGDSVQVMASLARREDLAGKVQMIYMDPPYGIKYRSNFQPQVLSRDVKDKDADLTRDLETVHAYRDTWHLGIHSYLTYLRDRLVTARELLRRTGSIFVQISDENLHRVRQLLDEVFGPENFVSTISYAVSSGLGANLLPRQNDYIVWYAKDHNFLTYKQLYFEKALDASGASAYRLVEQPNGSIRSLTKEQLEEPGSIPKDCRVFRYGDLTKPGPGSRYTVTMNGRSFEAGKRWWGMPADAMDRAIRAERIGIAGNTLCIKRFLDDWRAYPVTNIWTDTGTGAALNKMFVVQTNPKVIERCMLMTTDVGDLVLDPTCGSGTTAFVAEAWGRRWITVDTSRVTIAITRQRLLCERYPYYKLRPIRPDEREGNPDNRWITAGIDGSSELSTFQCGSVARITLRSVSQNSNLDPLFAKHDPILDHCLADCNSVLSKVTQDIRQRLDLKLLDKQRAGGKRSITDADRRRWELPTKGQKFEHWTVPFDTDPDWPKELQQSVKAYRNAWRAKMDAVNACIAANGAQEELVDQPEVVRGVVRVSGPFTVEAVQPSEISLGAMDAVTAGESEELEDTFEFRNVESYLDQMTRLLKMDGVRFPNNKEMSFGRLERLVGQSSNLHAEGRWMPKGETDCDPEGKATVAVGFGPQYGPVTAKQVEDLIRSASRQGYDALVVAGFSFDGPAQAVIEESQHPKLHIHMAHIRPDINPGMAGLLKERPGSQLFTVFGQPRTRLEGPNARGEYKVKMEGVDIYDPVTNTIHSTEDSKVAAWFLDSDYDGRTFCMTQAFFPDRSAWDKLANALSAVLDANAFDKLSGTVSLPFPPGKHKCVAVKVIDPRGNEVMQIHKLG